MRAFRWLATLLAVCTASAAFADPIRVGIPEKDNLQFLAFWVAQGAGLFSAEGLDIQIVYPDVPNQSGMWLMQQRVDIAVIQPPIYLGMIADQQPFALFANLLANDPINLIVRGDVAKTLKLDPHAPLADRLKAIKGLRVAVAPEPQRRLRVLFAHAGLDADRDVQVTVRRADDQIAALTSGEVDALYIHTPFLQDAIVRLGAVLLVNQSGGDVSPLAAGQIHAMAATRAYLAAHPDVIRKVTRAIANAQSLIHRDRVAAVDALIKAGIDAPSRRHLDTIVDLYAPAVPRTPALSAAKLERNTRLYPARSTMPDFSKVRAADYIVTVNPGAAPEAVEHFDLGVIDVSAAGEPVPLSPMTHTISGGELRARQALTVKDALEYLPGVAVDHKAPRGQSSITIGGFDSRQVPLYIDGVPAYIPFDGFVDLGRYLTGNIGEIAVATGYSSSLLGPNALGGVVNIVTRQPVSDFEGDAFVGAGAGRQVNLGLNAGGRWRRVFASGSADSLESDYFTTASGDRRVNSAQRDRGYHGRLAWAPRPSDLYVISAASQRGRNGVPPYAGTAPLCPGGTAVSVPCVTPKYWNWPRWDTNSYYLNSSTRLGKASSLQMRAFYSDFANRQEMFDNASYSTMNLSASSGIVANRDHSAGGSGRLESLLIPRNTIGVSMFLKNDTHSERTTTFTSGSSEAITPSQRDRDRLQSYGVQDRIDLARHVTFTAGASLDRLEPIEAQDLTADRLSVTPFVVTAGDWVFNPTGAIAFSTPGQGNAFVAFARKSRFPTIKDRYSYKSGRALPNPALRPELARTWSAGYSRGLGAHTTTTVEWQRSHVADEIENISFLSPLCPAAGAGTGGGGGGGRVPGACQQAVNVGAEFHHVASVSVRTTIMPRLAIDANYSYLHREIEGSTTAIVTGTPRHKAVATATIGLTRGIAAIVTMQHQSGIVAMSDNGLALPEARFTVVDVGATAPLSHGASLQLGAKNLGNRDYFYWEGFPEAGRNAYATLRYRF